MERWCGHYRIAAVEFLIKTQSVLETQRGFRQKFQRRDTLPHFSAIVGIEVASRRISEGL
jgi:hypothetical protein